MDDRQVEAALCGRVQRDARCTRTACAHRGGQEVRPRARRDVELGPGHDVALALFDGTGRQTGHVAAAVRFGDGQSDDRLAAQDGPGDSLDLRRIARLDEVREPDAVGEQPAMSPEEPPDRIISSATTSASTAPPPLPPTSSPKPMPSSPAAAADRWRLRGSAPSSSHRRR
jgi:hypothetical protein